MDSKQKAKELVEKFCKLPIHAATLHLKRNNPEFRMDFQSAKQCALIYVEEIMNCVWYESTYKQWGLNCTSEETTREFWQQVKKEIEHY